MVNLKTLRVIGVAVMLFCAFQLGRIQGETEYLKRIVECVKINDEVTMQEFYGHSFKGLEHTLWNHAQGHNAHIYLQCMFKDLYR